MIIYDYVIGSSLVALAAHHIRLPVTRLASEQCSERQAIVKQNICNIVGLKVVLSFVLYHSNMFNVRLLGMRAQNKPLYAFQRPKRVYCTRFKHTQIKQSGFTLPRQI